jgi:hypothetical protein
LVRMSYRPLGRVLLKRHTGPKDRGRRFGPALDHRPIRNQGSRTVSVAVTADRALLIRVGTVLVRSGAIT